MKPKEMNKMNIIRYDIIVNGVDVVSDVCQKKMRQLKFEDEEMESAKSSILIDAYCKYAGIRQYPVVKAWEYAIDMQYAEKKMKEHGRDIDQEVYDKLCKKLLSDILITMFGQWAKYSSDRLNRMRILKIRKLFSDEKKFFNFIVEEMGKEESRYSYECTNEEFINLVKQDKYLIYAVFTGVKSPVRREWGI